jgi:hypothetical protein
MISPKKQKGSLRRFGVGFVLLGALCLLSGCYETDHEVISKKDAQAVGNLPGHYPCKTDATGKCWTDIKAVKGCHDYRFKTSAGESGIVRALFLMGDCFIVQIKLDDKPYYLLDFYKFDEGNPSQGFSRVTHLHDAELARKCNVTFEENGHQNTGANYLAGSAKNIKKFLLAHDREDIDEDTPISDDADDPNDDAF